MEVTTKINGQALSVEVSVEVYECIDRADHKEENLAHEKRRHWDIREFDEYIVATEGRGYQETPEEWVCRRETLDELLSVLESCTATQRRRFLLYALDGLSFEQIARLDGCSKYAVRDFVEATRKKFQDFFKTRPHETPFSANQVRGTIPITKRDRLHRLPLLHFRRLAYDSNQSKTLLLPTRQNRHLYGSAGGSGRGAASTAPGGKQPH